MLLPSAFPIDALHQPHSSTSTSIPLLTNPGNSITLSSCRALQAILGNRPASPFRLTLSTSLQQKHRKPAISSPSEQPHRTPLLSVTQNAKVPSRPPTRSQVTTPVAEAQKTNKRTRADFEATDENNLNNSRAEDSDYFSHLECTSTINPNSTICPPERHTFSTPKRLRRVPLLMPLGLSAEDFEGLDTTPKAQPQAQLEPVEEKLDLPIENRAADDTPNESGWSTADDRMLVSTVLDKLNLSRKDWNDCGRRMERESDSLGKRWRVLVRDGEGGLRRGSGVRCRPELRGEWKDDRII